MARGGRNSSRGGRGGSSRGGNSRGGSRGKSDNNRGGSKGRGKRGGRGGDADFVMIGSVTLSRGAADNEDKILDTMLKDIEDGASLEEVIQNSGLQMWLNLWWPDDQGSLEFNPKDKILMSFKEPHQDAPDYNLATASFDKNS